MRTSARPASRRHVGGALIGGVLAISTAAIFFRLATDTHPLLKAATRLAISALLLLPAIILARRRGALNRRVVGLAITAGTAYALHFGSWVWSLDLTDVASSVTLVTTTPLFLALYGYYRGDHRPSTTLWTGIGISAVGVSFFAIGAQHPASMLGNALALVGALAMAGYMLTAERAQLAGNLWAFMGIATASAAFFLVLTATAVGFPINVGSSQDLLWLMLAALIPQLLGHGLLTWSLAHVQPATTAMATVGEPAIAALLAWFVFAEQITPLIGIGCILTSGAVLFTLVRR